MSSEYNYTSYTKIGPSTGLGYSRCSICGETYPKDQFRKYKGKLYGIPCGCHNDIKGLRRKGK